MYAHHSVAMIDSIMNTASDLNLDFVTTNNGVWASNTARWSSNNQSNITLTSNYAVSASNYNSTCSNYAYIATMAASYSNASSFASNLSVIASNTASFASNVSVSASNTSTFASNASVWASNAIPKAFTNTATLTQDTWFGLPVYMKSYTILSYATDTVIDSSLTSTNTTIIDCKGCAEYSGKVIPLPCGNTTSLPNFFVTPYASSTGLYASSYNTLDRLNISIRYVIVSSYDAA